MSINKTIATIITISIMLFLAGCSKEAMPITANNVQEYFKKTNEAANNIDGSLSEVERMKAVAREPLEEMGYDFDATLVSLFKHGSLDPAGMALMSNAFSYVIDTVCKSPDESVQKGLVSEETKNKLLLIKKYPLGSSKEELAKQMKIINLIRQCQSENNNLCTGEKLYEVFVKNGIAQPMDENLPDTRSNEIVAMLSPILQTNIVRSQNGNVISDGYGLENNFMITDQDYATLQKDLKDPWWIQ